MTQGKQNWEITLEGEVDLDLLARLLVPGFLEWLERGEAEDEQA